MKNFDSFYSQQCMAALEVWTFCVCVSVVDKELDVPLWMLGGRNKCQVHVIDFSRVSGLQTTFKHKVGYCSSVLLDLKEQKICALMSRNWTTTDNLNYYTALSCMNY